MKKFRMMTETHTHRNLDIDEAIQLFLTSKRSEKKSEQTLVSYKGGLERFKRWFRENDHSEFSRSCIESYVNYLTYERKKWIDHPNIPARNAAGLSSRTVNNAVRILKVFLHYLETEKYIGGNPIMTMKLQPVDEREFPIFTEDQVRRILAIPDKRTFPGYRDYVMMLVLLDTGIRVGELVKLKVSDIDFQLLQITLGSDITKTRRTRILPFSESVAKELFRLIEYCGLDRDSPLWLTQYGEPCSKQVFAKAIKEYGSRAGIEGVRCSPHTFRHTFATMYLLNGGDPFSLQKILGHSSMDMVLVYVNLTNKNLHEQHVKFSPVASLQPNNRKRGSIRFK